MIIPNYNHAPYLKQRIDSVLNQTYADIEVIILDDCSTDNSRAIIESYRDHKKISSILYNEVNSGNTFLQWHKGIQLTKGEYIWIAESDDWCEKNFLDTIISGLEKKEDAVFGYCQSFCVNDKGDILFQSNYHRLEDYYQPGKYLENFLCFRNAVFNAGMAVFRKNFYYKLNDFYRSFRYAGDWVFWAELSRLGCVYINAKPLNYFRKHGNDVTGRMNASGENFVEELKVLSYFHKQLGLNESLYFKAKLKLYNKFITTKAGFDDTIREQAKTLFFENISFFKKQYFLAFSALYKLKMQLQKRINAPNDF